jgi:ferritin-like metal-binding protein YciE
MGDIRAWAIDELRRMEDTRIQLAFLLEEAEQACTLQLLKASLADQRAVNQALQGRLRTMFEAVGVEPGPLPSAAARALVQEARDAFRPLRGPSRDVAISLAAVRIELWEIGVWRGLASLFRLLVEDGVADAIDGWIGDLADAERHLASVAVALTPEVEGHAHETTRRHRPRLPLNVGPAE